MAGKTSKQLGLILLVFVGIIVGIAFINAIATTVTDQTQFSPITNESLSISTLRIAGNDINDTLNLTLAHSNWSGAPSQVRTGNGTILIANTDYAVDTALYRVRFLNSTTMVSTLTNTTSFDYSYKSGNYIADGTSRSIIPLILLFSVIGLIIFALIVFYNREFLDMLGERVGYGG